MRSYKLLVDPATNCLVGMASLQSFATVSVFIANRVLCCVMYYLGWLDETMIGSPLLIPRLSRSIRGGGRGAKEREGGFSGLKTKPEADVNPI